MNEVFCLALHLGNRFLTEAARRQLAITDNFERFTRIQLGQRFGALAATAENLMVDLLPGALLTLHDQDYPALLRETSHAPFALFLQGDRRLLGSDKVSLVGTREPSRGGRQAATNLGRHFVQTSQTIVSGIARGVDAICHHAALDAGGATIAVLPNGFDHLYPLENRDIYQQAKTGKQILLLTEYPPTQKPMKHHFVRRNRIIAGLSPMTVFVEGHVKSGGMITVNAALTEGRDVAALKHISLTENSGGERLVGEGAIDLTDHALGVQTLRV